jgi:glucan 1,3-beta-glucosidase
MGLYQNPRRQHRRLARPRTVSYSQLYAPLITYSSWITPSIFESLPQNLNIVDEYTLTSRLPTQAGSILQQHWSTWATLSDFEKIASAGINLIRIPVGYWAFDNSESPYIPGAASYLTQALYWARQTGLKVLIDLHGAPGSQNGFDNSGQRMDPSQMTFLQDGMYGRTAQVGVDVLSQIAERYAGAKWQDVVVGIELLNEPLGWVLNQTDLRAWLAEGYGRVRAFGSTAVVIQDGFLELSSWNGFLMPRTDGAQNVAMGSYGSYWECGRLMKQITITIKFLMVIRLG